MKRVIVIGMCVAMLAPVRVAGHVSDAFVHVPTQELFFARRLSQLGEALFSVSMEQESLVAHARMLAHVQTVRSRKLASYSASGSARARAARGHARALYKLARGGIVRSLAEASSFQTDHDRVMVARRMRWLVAREIRELAGHRDAGRHANAELLTEARELQTVAALEGFARAQNNVLQRSYELTEAVLQGSRAAPRAPANVNRRLASTSLPFRHRGLTIPVEGPVVDHFGPWSDPISGLPMERHGIELGASAGARVRAVADGVVAFVGLLPGYRYVVVLDHGGGFVSVTGRLVGVHVLEGQTVTRGQTLGSAASGSHGSSVYLELRHGGRAFDPDPYLDRETGAVGRIESSG